MDNNIEEKEEYESIENVASGTDMTGLISRAPDDAAELESYQEVYSFLPPVDKGEKAE